MDPTSSPDQSQPRAPAAPPRPADPPSTFRDRGNTLFVDMSRPRQGWEAIGGAAVTGAVCGLLMGFSVWAYVLGVVVSFVGGLPAGGQHRTLPGALTRTFIAGSLWAAAVVIAVRRLGRTPAIVLPESLLAFLPWGFLPACALAVPSWYLARRRRARLID